MSVGRTETIASRTAASRLRSVSMRPTGVSAFSGGHDVTRLPAAFNEAVTNSYSAIRCGSLKRTLRSMSPTCQPRSAVEYAKKAHSLAPNDPSAARLLAAAFRAAGKLSDAEELLVMAMAIKSENDTLTAELRHDLAEVRRLLAQS